MVGFPPTDVRKVSNICEQLSTGGWHKWHMLPREGGGRRWSWLERQKGNEMAYGCSTFKNLLNTPKEACNAASPVPALWWPREPPWEEECWQLLAAWVSRWAADKEHDPEIMRSCAVCSYKHNTPRHTRRRAGGPPASWQQHPGLQSPVKEMITC